MAKFRTRPYLQNPAADAMTVTWFTDSAEPGTLNVSGVGSFISTPVLAAALEYQTPELIHLASGDRPSLPYKHSIRVTGLEPKTSYSYSVDLGDGSGNDSFAAEFVTAPGSTETVRFVVYADSETEPESSVRKRDWGTTNVERPDWIEEDSSGRELYLVNQTDGYRENLRAISDFAPDLVLIAGDLVESGGEQRDWDEFWRHNAGGVSVQDSFVGEHLEAGIANSVPILPALGNHENFGGPGNLGGYNGNIVVEGQGEISATNFSTDKYLEYFEVPSNGAVDDPNTVEDESKHDGRYYRLDYGKVTFITLDSSDGEAHQSEQDTNFYIQPEANAPDLNPGSRQFQWAQTQLADAHAQGQTIFVQFHHFPYSVGPHGVLPGPGGFQSGVPMQIYSPLFEQYGVTAVFSGHGELYEHSIVNDVHYYDIGIGGDGLRAPIPGLEHPSQTFTAHGDEPEVWVDTNDDGVADTLEKGGKHYGHLQVEVSFHPNGKLKNETLTPVYVLPKTDISGNILSFETKKYDDVLTIENPMPNYFSQTPDILSTNADGALFISAEDIDGDGDGDLLYATRVKREIGWYENLGNGVISTTANIIATGLPAQTLEAADVDGDGDLDIFAALSGSNKVAWYENSGGGIFGSQNIISANTRYAADVTLADLDGDDDLDVITAAFGRHVENIGRVAWHENLGDNTFTTEKIISDDTNGARIVEVDDIDGDGRLDIISASLRDDKIAWYKNLGNGEFSEQRIITTGDGAFSVITADVDGDGKPDALYTFRTANTIAWSKNLGDGNFGPQNIISTTSEEAFSLRTFDIDKDGDLDLFAASYADDTYAWYENLGGGDFGPENTISTTSDGAAWMALEDFDDDGDVDFATASFDAATISIYENLTSSSSSIATITPPEGFTVTEFASDLDYPNGMIVLEGGALLVGTSEPNVDSYFFSGESQLLLLSDSDQNGIADERIVVASGLAPTITHIKQAGDLIFVSSYSERKTRSEISAFRLSGTPGDMYEPFLLEPLGKIDFLFDNSSHVTVPIIVRETAPEQYELFFSLGAEENNVESVRPVLLGSSDFDIVETSLNADSIYRVSIDSSGENLEFGNAEQIASGLRNAADFAFEENSGDLYLIENGIDGILTESLAAAGEGADLNEPLTADELNKIIASTIGGNVEDFGFANEGTRYRTGELIDGQGNDVSNSENYVDPLAVFQPINDSESEGPASLTFAPSAFPDNFNNGVFIGFFGRWGTTGLANEENPVLYYDFDNQSYSQFISNDEPGIGYPISLAATSSALFIADLSASGQLRNPRGLGQGRIYKFSRVPDIAGTSDNDSLIGTNTSEFIFGDAGNDQLIGRAGADTMVGGRGNDYLRGDEGGDVLDGGLGIDTIDYVTSLQGVQIDLSSNIATGGDAANDTISGFENVYGSHQSDTLTGDGLGNRLIGRAGNDILIGGQGNDHLRGDAGGDVLEGGFGIDTVDYVTSPQGVQIDLSNNTTANGDATGDTINGFENVYGSHQNDTLTGDGMNNRLIGHGGNDTLIGRDGNDILIGGQGNDYLRGDEGGDVLDGGLGIDTIDYVTSLQGVQIDLSSNIATSGDAADDTISGFENVYGSHQNDTLTGDGMNNRLVGRAGNDILIGGQGNDHLRGDAGGDVLDGGLGNDWADYTNSTAPVKVDLLAGTGMGGHADGDTLISIERVRGSAFDDQISGDANNNSINGQGGNDSLEGGLGHDIFRYNKSSFGMDSIVDFEDGVDRINLRGSGLTFGSFELSQQGANTLLKLDSENSILLIGISSENITAADFVS